MNEMNEMTKVGFAKRFLISNVRAYVLIFVISAIQTGTLLLTLWIFGFNVEDLRVLGGVVLFTPVCAYYVYRVIMYIWLLRNYLLDSKRNKNIKAKYHALSQKFNLNYNEMSYVMVGYAKLHGLPPKEVEDAKVLDVLLSKSPEEILAYKSLGIRVSFPDPYTESSTKSPHYDFSSQHAVVEPSADFDFTDDWFPRELNEDPHSGPHPGCFTLEEDPYDDLSGNPWDDAIELDPDPDPESED